MPVLTFLDLFGQESDMLKKKLGIKLTTLFEKPEAEIISGWLPLRRSFADKSPVGLCQQFDSFP